MAAVIKAVAERKIDVQLSDTIVNVVILRHLHACYCEYGTVRTRNKMETHTPRSS